MKKNKGFKNLMLAALPAYNLLNSAYATGK
jgi:hypothetical protein